MLRTLRDLIVVAGFIRPKVLIDGLQHQQSPLSAGKLLPLALISLSGLLVEPLAYLQQIWYGRKLKQVVLPSNPVIVIGHWRSGTTYLHTLLGADPQFATARNSLICAPQVALLLKPIIETLLKHFITCYRPIDNVSWNATSPQEDEVGLARLTADTNMLGVTLPQDYRENFKRTVLRWTNDYEKQLNYFSRLTWLHSGPGKSTLLIKNPAHTARIPLLLKLFPSARFILLKRQRQDSVGSLVLVKQRLHALVSLQQAPNQCHLAEESLQCHAALLHAFERDRHLLGEKQLVEVDYDQLIKDPFGTIGSIYNQLEIPHTEISQHTIKAKIEELSSYKRHQTLALNPTAAELIQKD